jgi:hypothetical protein
MFWQVFYPSFYTNFYTNSLGLYSIDQGSPCPLATLNPFGRELLLLDVFTGLKRSTRIKRIL